MRGLDIMKAAEKRADEIGREPLPVVPMVKHRKCGGTGGYRYASGAMGDCVGCINGMVPATKEARAIIQAAKVVREERRLRVLFVGCHDMRLVELTRGQEEESARFMESIRQRLALIKTNPAVVL